MAKRYKTAASFCSNAEVVLQFVNFIEERGKEVKYVQPAKSGGLCRAGTACVLCNDYGRGRPCCLHDLGLGTRLMPTRRFRFRVGSSMKFTNKKQYGYMLKIQQERLVGFN